MSDVTRLRALQRVADHLWEMRRIHPAVHQANGELQAIVNEWQNALLVREAVAPQVNEVVPLDCTALVAREGWDCAACGHRHAGRTLANICIGCPCPETSPRLAGEAVAPPSPAGTYEAERRCCSVCDAKKVCHVCGETTLLACSDCRIDFGVTVYVCKRPACRDEHEAKCSARLRERALLAPRVDPQEPKEKSD
jgi:hypothetical protein